MKNKIAIIITFLFLISVGNVVFRNPWDFTGIHAPDVGIVSTLIIGDIDARGEAYPALIIGYSPLASSSGAVLVSGGDLSKSNGRSIIVADSSPGFQSIRSIGGADRMALNYLPV